jgi:hypothetical protein
MDSIGVQVAILLAILLLIVLLVSAWRHAGHGGGTGPVVTWFVLTALVLWAGGMLAFAAVHALLFAFGTAAAAVGLAVCGVLLLATPFALAVVVRRATHDLSPR